jgi:hypothetical protein
MFLDLSHAAIRVIPSRVVNACATCSFTAMPPRPPCVFFLRNACSYGDSCRNSHVIAKSNSVASPPPLSDPSSPTCAYFLRGLCRFGDQCREFHPPESSLSRSVNIWPTKPPCRYFIRGSCDNGTNCPFSHEAGEILSIAEAKSFPKTRDLIPTHEGKPLPLFSPRRQPLDTRNAQVTLEYTVGFTLHSRVCRLSHVVARIISYPKHIPPQIGLSTIAVSSLELVLRCCRS